MSQLEQTGSAQLLTPVAKSSGSIKSATSQENSGFSSTLRQQMNTQQKQSRADNREINQVKPRTTVSQTKQSGNTQQKISAAHSGNCFPQKRETDAEVAVESQKDLFPIQGPLLSLTPINIYSIKEGSAPFQLTPAMLSQKSELHSSSVDVTLDNVAGKLAAGINQNTVGNTDTSFTALTANLNESPPGINANLDKLGVKINNTEKSAGEIRAELTLGKFSTDSKIFSSNSIFSQQGDAELKSDALFSEKALAALNGEQQDVIGKLSKEQSLLAKGFKPADEDASFIDKIKENLKQESSSKNLSLLAGENDKFKLQNPASPANENLLVKLANLKSSLNLQGNASDTAGIMNDAAAAVTDLEQAALTPVRENSLIGVQPKLMSGVETSFILNARQPFTPGLASRIQWMVSQAQSSAEILMDPPEMGPLSVKIQQVNGETNIMFQVNNAQTKELLDDNLSKLKEMMLQSGINLGETHVRQNNQQNATGDGENSTESAANSGQLNDPESDMSVQDVVVSQNLVDVYS